MARRVVNGNTHSENGWPLVDQGSCMWARVPGAEHVTVQLQNGVPLTVILAFLADYHVHIEPLRDPDTAGWTPSNSVLGQSGRNNGSNHLGGTCVDANWEGPNRKRFRLGISKEEAYPGKTRELDELLNFYEDNIFCGGEWSIQDWMHFQMGGETYDSRADRPSAKVEDFIRRKIRADGFSTYKRGGTPAQPPAPAPVPTPAPQPNANAIRVLAQAAGVSTDKAAAMLPAMSAGLRAAQCTNPNRIGMFIAQCGHESAGYQRTEEYASGAAYEGRRDLGNTQPGDGVRFKGRTWIQITGRHNYGEFSKWAHSKGLVSSATYFVDRPVELQDMKWAGVGAAWYWTVARGTRINEASDRRDLVTVTQLINGGQNGAPDRKQRYDRAMALGDQLLVLTSSTPTAPTPAGDDELSAEAERMIREMYDEYRKEKRGPSRAFLATDGNPVDSPLGMLWNTDGNVWDVKLTFAYLFHVPDAIEAVETVAAGGCYAGAWARDNAWLNEFGQAYCQGLVEFKAALINALTGKQTAVVSTTTTATPAPAVTAVVDTRELTEAYDESVTDYTKFLLSLSAEGRQGHLAALRALEPPTGN